MTVPLIVAGDILKMRAWTIAGNQAAVNTWWFLCTAIAGAGGSLLDAATALDALIAADYKALMSSQSEYRGIEAYVMRTPLPLPQSSIANAGVGSNGATNLPTQTCGITTWTTDFTGVSLRGRTYWSFPGTTSDVGGGQPSTTYVTNVTSLSSAVQGFVLFGSGGNTSTIAMILKRGKNKEGVQQPNQPITGFTVEAKWATQRRRGIGYGRPNVSPI